MLRGSEAWSLKRENELALHQSEMRMFTRMFVVKLRDKLSCIELQKQLAIEDRVKVLQRNRLRWYGYILVNDDSSSSLVMRPWQSITLSTS